MLIMGPVLARDNDHRGIRYWAGNAPLGIRTYWSPKQEREKESIANLIWIDLELLHTLVGRRTWKGSRAASTPQRNLWWLPDDPKESDHAWHNKAIINMELIRTHQFLPTQCKLSIIILYNHKKKEHGTRETRVQEYMVSGVSDDTRIHDHSLCSITGAGRKMDNQLVSHQCKVWDTSDTCEILKNTTIRSQMSDVRVSNSSRSSGMI